ncbi:ABC transporter ATP-binding protein [Ruegeria sp. R13_0]|uniref:ABC transporter transmembrane domain-containing protein n=1 Tax=Ruegeria sp. R13_0 TaxID=2821099 RepID=UPI001AD9DABD|nr:ABC transporter transmembrane domain-containing protein [Ruegeria sp. R13_0]MBO9434988.1 ABC transporter ATP-binding protein [Ruegeria sp. R13_0]
MKANKAVKRRTRLRMGIPLLAASLSLNILSLLAPITILLIFDRIIPFQSTDTLRILTWALVIGAGLEFALRWARSVLLTTAAEESAIARQRRFLEQVLNANPIRFAQDTASTYFDRYMAINQLREHQSGQSQTLAIDLPFTILFALMIGLIGGWLVLVPAAAFCIVLVFAGVMKHLQWSLFERRKALDTRRYAFLSALLSSLSTVKANRMEPQMARRFELLEDQTVDVSRKLILFSGFAQNFGAVFGQIMVAAMGLLGAYLVIQNMIGIAELAACMLLNGRIIQPLTKIMAIWVQSESVALSRRKLREMDSISQQLPSWIGHKKLKGDLRVGGLCLLHPQNKEIASRPVNFHVPAGTGILIEAEESWMVDALFATIQGNQKPNAGSCLIDEVATTERPALVGRGGIVALERDPAILSATLLDNLTAFGGAERAEYAKQIAATLGLEQRVHGLPEGYNTQLGKGSSFESDPVNRQLIALSRALALRPQILLMNEPSSVLDAPERQALATCLKTLSPRPSLVVASPDPRLRQLTDQSAQLGNPQTSDLLQWQEDAHQDTDEACRIKRGAA